MTFSNKKIHHDYSPRIHRVFKYIDENLDGDLSLTTLSNIAFFSPYHFHRVFKFMTNETLNDYVTRRRIEQSALELIHKDLGITEIATKYGFNDSSSFTRRFKHYYGLSPTEFKKQHPNKFSKIRQLERKNGQEYPDPEKYICIINTLKTWTNMNATIEIKDIPELHLAGLTHIGITNVETTFEKLIRWGNSKGLLGDSKSKIGRVFYDSMKVTDPSNVRMSIFLTTDKPIEPDGEINSLTIKKGKCIVGRFEITPNDFEKSWTGLFIWMNAQGYKKSVDHPFEIYHNDFREHPEHKFIVDLHIPIE